MGSSFGKIPVTFVPRITASEIGIMGKYTTHNHIHVSLLLASEIILIIAVRPNL